MVLLSARWPFSRIADLSAPRPDRLLRDNPALLLSALQAPDIVAGLVAEWNPRRSPEQVGTGTVDAGGVAVEDGIRWHGPIRLTPMLRADAGLPTTGPAASLGLAYVAEVRRERVKIGDSRQADRLRRRYPRGLPVGAEADAWHLVRGLAKRLRGVARLPGGPVHAPHEDPPLPGDTDHAVYSHEMLPWIVLREILRSQAPALARELVPGGSGYTLRHRDLIEVRVRSVGVGMGVGAAAGAGAAGTGAASGDLPYALRDRADAAWPRSVYEFCDLSKPSPDAPATGALAAGPVRSAAALIAEVTGGVLVDADGFPQQARALSGR